MNSYCSIDKKFETVPAYGRQSVYNIVGVHGNCEAQRAEQRSSKGREALGFWGGGQGVFPYPPVTEPGERCKLPQWGPGPSPGNLEILNVFWPICLCRSCCRFF